MSWVQVWEHCLKHKYTIVGSDVCTPVSRLRSAASTCGANDQKTGVVVKRSVPQTTHGCRIENGHFRPDLDPRTLFRPKCRRQVFRIRSLDTERGHFSQSVELLLWADTLLFARTTLNKELAPLKPQRT